MINVENYIRRLIELLKLKFGGRLLYVGLQGSYLRGEATQDSDIDIMVIIDELGVSDLDSYRVIVHSLDNYDKSCGFICSRRDLEKWNPLEIFNLLNGTKDYFGVLQEFVPEYTQMDICNFVKLSVNNIYHELCHSYIHGNSDQKVSVIKGAFKGAFFVLQHLYYLKSGKYIASKAEMLDLLVGTDRAVVQRSLEISRGRDLDFTDSF